LNGQPHFEIVTNMTDQELWDQLRRGDKSALERIYRVHIEHLSEYGLRFSGNRPLIEDCIQDLFVDLWQKRKKIRATDQIRPYLLVALRRRIVRALQKQSRRQDERPAEELAFSVELAIDELLIAEEVSEQQSQQLQAAFSTLSTRQREALYLRYYQGLSYDDIAEIMDLNNQSARNLSSSALKRLRKHMTAGSYLLLFWLFF